MSHRRNRPLPPLAKTIVVGTFVGFGLFIASVFATGSTFGQRCERLHPNDAASWETCVDRLSHGVRP